MPDQQNHAVAVLGIAKNFRTYRVLQIRPIIRLWGRIINDIIFRPAAIPVFLA